MYEATFRRLSTSRFGITLPRRVIEALNLANNDEVTVIILRPVTGEYTIRRGPPNLSMQGIFTTSFSKTNAPKRVVS
jgi:hypothetical protein